MLQVPEFYKDCEGDLQCVSPSICPSCVERWESRHAEMRKKAWATLPEVFGLKDRIRIKSLVVSLVCECVAQLIYLPFDFYSWESEDRP